MNILIHYFSFLEHFEMTGLGATTVGHTNGASAQDITMMSMLDVTDKETPLVNNEKSFDIKN